MIDEIDRAFDAGARRTTTSASSILAADGKHFSSGHDLKELVGPDADPDAARTSRRPPKASSATSATMYFDKCVRIYEFPKPTIAAVQGKCIAAGVMLAAMCDLIVASDDATFQNPVARMSGMGVELLVEPWELGHPQGQGVPAHRRLDRRRRGVALGHGQQGRRRATSWRPTAREMADKIALVPPVTAERIKDSINQTFEFMGKRNSWNFHFMAHHFTHNTATALGKLDEREQMGSMKEVFDARDRGDS